MRFIKNSQSGEFYIDLTVSLIIILLLVAFFLAIMPVIIQKSNLNTYVEEVVRTAEITGEVGEATNKRAAVLTEELGIKPELIWDNENFDGSKKIQLNGKIKLTGVLNTKLDFFIFKGFNIQLKSSASGASEMYWK